MSTPTQPVKKLYRSRDDRFVAGVCGGLAAYFGIDSTWVRILFILLFFAGGSALIVYLIFWLVTPQAPL